MANSVLQRARCSFLGVASHSPAANGPISPPGGSWLRRFSHRSSAFVGTSAKDSTALFGVPFLRQPDDFPRAAKIAVSVCNPLIKELLDEHKVGLGTLHKLDTLSDTICKVLDAAECVRNVHGGATWREAAETTFHSLAQYMYHLNAFKPLYDALCKVTNDATIMAGLTEEQRRMGIMLRREFERDGIHLDDSTREQIVALNSDVGQRVSSFLANIASPPVAFAVPDAASVWTTLPMHIRDRLLSQHNRKDSNSLVLTTDAGVAAYVMRHVANDAVRQSMSQHYNNNSSDNIAHLHALRDDRQKLARMIGFDSYAHMVCSDRMAGRPENAVAFLQTLSRAVMPRAAAELLLLSRTKAASARINDAATSAAAAVSDASGSAAARQIAARVCECGGAAVAQWDLPFYSNMVTAQRNSIDAHEVAAYFPLPAVLDGLQSIMHRVFGVTMVRLPVADGEAWSGGDAGSGAGTGIGSLFAWGKGPRSQQSGATGASPLLVKYALRHDSEGALGTMYLDLFARPNKFTGAAHFVIRCGKKLHEGDGRFEEALGVQPQVASIGGHPEQTFQLPIIALVTNLAAPSVAQSDPFSRVLMTHVEVETLFHEFGHALHSLLSRTEFQHLSGTRGALDFVEVPSHVMEYFARDYRVVKTFARHHVTGEPIPEDLWKRVMASRSTFAAMDLQQAIATAMFDQALFGSQEVVESILNGCPAVDADRSRSGSSESTSSSVDVEALVAGLDAGGGSPSSLAPAPPLLSYQLPPGYLQEKDMVIPLAGPDDALKPMPHLNNRNTSSTSEVKPIDSTELLAAVHARYAVAPALPGSKWHATFAHAATYGGGYYSYIYAAALSSALWQKLFAADPFSRSAGEVYRQSILSKGAAADPAQMLRTVLGGEPSIKPLLTELGLLR